MRTIAYLASVPLLIAAQAAPPPVPPAPPEGYALVWADKFDVDGAPDAKNWTFENGFVRKHYGLFEMLGWSGTFHVWRMAWDERSIRLSVDDVWMNDVDLDQTVNQDGTGINPLRQPHYMLVNLAIGGTSRGDPSATAFPSRLEVDYIRVYQKRR